MDLFGIFDENQKTFVFSIDHNSATEGPFRLRLKDYNTAFQSLQGCLGRKKTCDSPRNK